MLRDPSYIQQIQEFLQHMLSGLSLLQNGPDWFWGPNQTPILWGSFLGIK